MPQTLADLYGPNWNQATDPNTTEPGLEWMTGQERIPYDPNVYREAQRRMITGNFRNAQGQAPADLNWENYYVNPMVSGGEHAAANQQSYQSMLDAGGYYDPSKPWNEQQVWMPKNSTATYLPQDNSYATGFSSGPMEALISAAILGSLGYAGGSALGLFGDAATLGAGGEGLTGLAAGDAAGAAAAGSSAEALGTAASNFGWSDAATAGLSGLTDGFGAGAMGAAGAGATGGNVSTLSDLWGTADDLYGSAGWDATAGSGGGMDWINAGQGLPADFWGTASDLTSTQGWDATAGLGEYASGGSSSLFDIVKQYGQPAAKALGLTKPDGSIDWGRIAGGAGSAALGMYGANQSANAMERISDKYMNLGAPYRQKLSDLYANPNSFLSSQEVQAPVQQGTDAMARALSVKGNPTGNATALQEMQNYSSNMLFGKLGEEKNRLGALGGLSSMPASVGMGADMSAAGSSGSGLNALGYGLNSMLNPKPSAADLWKQFSTSLT